MGDVTFYVYVYYDGRLRKGFEAIYVGKGKDTRSHDHLKGAYNSILERKLCKHKMENVLPKIVIMEARDEAHAFVMERSLIAHFGRIDLGTGSLCNFTDGGDGSSGRVETAESNLKRSNTITRTLKNPQIKAARERAQAVALANPLVKEKQKANTAKAWRNPEVLKKRALSNEDPAVRQRRQTGARNANAKPEVKENKRKARELCEGARAQSYQETMELKRRLKYPAWTAKQHHEHTERLLQLKLRRKTS